MGVYYVVSEALTNVIKHAEAAFVQVDLEADECRRLGSGSRTTASGVPTPATDPAWSG